MTRRVDQPGEKGRNRPPKSVVLKGLFEEYRTLCRASDRLNVKMHQLSLYEITAMGTIIGFGILQLGTITPLFFFLPILIAVPLELERVRNVTGILRIAYYIRRHVESKITTMRWEHFVKQLRKERPHYMHWAKTNPLFLSISVVSILLFAYEVYITSWTVELLAAYLIAFGISSAVVIYVLRLPRRAWRREEGDIKAYEAAYREAAAR